MLTKRWGQKKECYENNARCIGKTRNFCDAKAPSNFHHHGSILTRNTNLKSTAIHAMGSQRLAQMLLRGTVCMAVQMAGVGQLEHADILTLPVCLFALAWCSSKPCAIIMLKTELAAASVTKSNNGQI